MAATVAGALAIAGLAKETVPKLVSIIKRVQRLFGKGTGVLKKEAAVKLAEAEGVPDPGDKLEVVLAILKELGVIDGADPEPPTAILVPAVNLEPGQVYPVVFEVHSFSNGSFYGNLKRDSNQ